MGLVLLTNPGGVATSVVASGHSAGSTVWPCAIQNLTIVPTHRGLGVATGNVGLWYRVHLDGRVDCTLRGFPVVELGEGRGRAVRAPSTHGGYIFGVAPAVRTVRVTPRADAYFAVEWEDVDPFCPVRYLRVALRHSTPAIDVRSVGMVTCGGTVGVSPFEPRPIKF